MYAAMIRASENAAEGISGMCSQQNNRIRAGNSSISSSPGQFCFPERNGFLSRHFFGVLTRITLIRMMTVAARIRTPSFSPASAQPRKTAMTGLTYA